MATEHEFNRTRQASEVDFDVSDCGPNRATPSSQLTAPIQPWTSGILHRRARDANGVADGAEHAVAAASGSSGMALPTTLMRKFESSLGADLSSVRVHTESASQAATDAVGARAYAVGNDIHFAAGQYNPSSSAGEHLLAHEVAHTVQQSGGAQTRQNKLEVSSPADAAEHEADRAADAMVSGARAVISTAPVSAARLIQRHPEGGEAGEKKAQVNPKTTFELPEYELNEPFGNYVQLVGSLRGKITMELAKKAAEGGESADVVAGPSGSAKGVGVAAEITLAENTVKRAIMGAKFDDKVEDKVNFVFTSEKVEVSVSHEARLTFPDLPWLKAGGDLKFIFAGVDLKKLRDDKGGIDALAADVALVLGGEGNMSVGGVNAKVGVEGAIGVKASPNWKKIGGEAVKKAAKEGAKEVAKEGAKEVAKEGAKEVAKQGAKEVAKEGAKEVAKQGAKEVVKEGAKEVAKDAAKTAAEAGAESVVEGIAVDTAGVAASASALILPLAAAAVMIYGGMQAGDNRMVGQAATAYGAKARDCAREYAKSYAMTIAGHQQGGTGAAAAEAVLSKVMAGKFSREEASAAILAKSGGYAAVYDAIYAQTRDKLYAAGVTTLEDKFRSSFGLIEKIGETWGMRGVIRDDLHRVLYAE